MNSSAAMAKNPKANGSQSELGTPWLEREAQAADHAEPPACRRDLPSEAPLPATPPSERFRVLFYYSHQHIDTGSPNALLGMVEALRGQCELLYIGEVTTDLGREMGARSCQLVDTPVAALHWGALPGFMGALQANCRSLRAERVDLLHVNEFGHNLSLVLAAYLCRVRIVLHVHNPERIRFWNFHWLLADRIAIASAYAASRVRPARLVKNRLRLLYNTILWDRFESGRSIRPELGLTDEDLVIAVIAQMTPEKGTDVVLDTLAILKANFGISAKFLMVGRVGEDAEQCIKQLTRRAIDEGLADQFLILGVRTDVPDILASADLFFLPTKDEIFGVAVLEAMARGLPVVAPRVGALPELIHEEGQGVLLDTRDAAIFANHIAALLRDPRARDAMGKNATRAAAAKFGLPVVTAQLVQIYREANERRRGPRNVRAAPPRRLTGA